MNEYRIVRFDQYCKKCKNWKTDECKDPCEDCLGEPFRIDTRVPAFFDAKDQATKEKIQRLYKL